MKQDYLKDKIKTQYKLEGTNMYTTNAEFIRDEISNINSKVIQKENVNKLERGKFYFIVYDLNGKSSKMEKFNPLFVLDWFDRNNTRMLYAVSVNFLPVAIRTVFFNNITNFNLDILEKNENYDLKNERPFNNINFLNIYNLLKTIGFEWAIRQFDMRLINDINVISTNILTEFITMSTVQFTGVDDLKLLDIWKKKITQQEEREKKIISQILNDYETMEKELNIKQSTLTERNNNIQKSLDIIKKNF